MKPVIVIPTYWEGTRDGALAPGAYDHTTSVSSTTPDLSRCLRSLRQVRNLPPVVVLAVCPAAQTPEVRVRVQGILREFADLDCRLVTNIEASRIAERVAELAPHAIGEGVSLRGYGAIRNMGLAVAAIMGCDAVVFMDDDEIALGPDFMEKALYALGQQNRQGLPILAKSGYFYDRSGSPLADEGPADLTTKWWTKRPEFNSWMRRALAATRISRSNYVCGGCLALHARAYMHVAFDPWITRGEDLDYLISMRLYGFEMWFDNQWVVRHLPPETPSRAARFMQDVYRWFYERAKVEYANRQHDLNPVSPASLMPYPGPWISDQLDQRVRKTAFARAALTREKAAYLRVAQSGIADAQAYAADNASNYVRFQSFWPAIMNGLWNDAELAAVIDGALKEDDER